jgi:hypothetical protein
VIQGVIQPVAEGRRARRNVAAILSIPVGLLGVAVLPAAIYVAETRVDIALIDSAAAIPIAALLGVSAILLGRRGRRRSGLTVTGRGAGAARMGRALGLLALLLAGTAALALGWYALLTWRARS